MILYPVRGEIMKSNIILIGMPAAGKSTIGVLLAKSLLKDFVDTDLVIQTSCGCTLSNIIEKEGTDTFLKIENDIMFIVAFHKRSYKIKSIQRINWQYVKHCKETINKH